MDGVARKRSLWRLASAAVFAAGGAYLGYTFGAGSGSTILTEWFSAIVALALAILILFVVVVVAVLIRWKSTNSDPAFRSVIRVGALFVAGIALGWVLSAIFASAEGRTSRKATNLERFGPRSAPLVVAPANRGRTEGADGAARAG